MKKYVLNCLQTSFSQISAEPGAAPVTRFKIVFKPAVTILPVKQGIVNTHQKDISNEAAMKTGHEPEMANYDLEASTDGALFVPVVTEMEAMTNNTYNTYSWLDVNAVQGNNYYRIKSYDKSGEVAYSSVLKVAI